MCRRFQLLMRIEEASIQEIVNYLRRLGRVYGILLVLEIIGTILNTAALYWNIATIILYLGSIISLFLLVRTPCIAYTYLPMTSSLGLAVLDSIQMIYLVATDTEYLALLRLIPISIQLSTIFIAHKLREKMNGQDDIEAGGVAVSVANPVLGTRAAGRG